MYRYIVCIGICTAIWILIFIVWNFNVRKRIKGIKQQIKKIFMPMGMGIFSNLVVFSLTIGKPVVWMCFDILWLRIIGFILFIPAAILVFSSFLQLKRKGEPETIIPTESTVFINTGIYGIVRQPMTFGMAIWSVALILTFQTVISIILGTFLVFCFWMAARKEAEYNIEKFGDEYKEYMKKVPMWDVFKGLRK